MTYGPDDLPAGTSITIAGEPGAFVVRWVTANEVTCWGGRPGHERFRSFALATIKTIKTKREERP